MTKQKLTTHYVYMLSHNSVPFYIGCSVNPAKRLYDHFGRNSYPNVHAVVRKIKKPSLVQITILQKFNTWSSIKCKKATKIEQKWIAKYIKEGHALANGVICKF